MLLRTTKPGVGSSNLPSRAKPQRKASQLVRVGLIGEREICITQDVIDRFRSYVAHGPGCWRWCGSRTGRGYGAISIGRRGSRVIVGAHQLAVLISGRDIPAGMEVCHSCDVPDCVNSGHLAVQTHHENMREMVDRTLAAKNGFAGLGSVPLSRWSLDYALLAEREGRGRIEFIEDLPHWVRRDA